MKTPLFTAILFFAATLGAPANPLSSSQIKQIDAIARQAMKTQHVSGIEVGVGRAGKLLYAQGYGLRDRAKNLPVTAETIFPVGSITKQFTAATVMQLVEQGKVDLNARVSRYLPSAPHAGEITVRELLNQTSGLPDYLEDKALLASIMTGTVGPQSVPKLVALVDGKPLHFKPGTKYEYSNTNYALAGLIVAHVTGTPYGQVLQTAIFTPVGMKDSQYLSMSVPKGPNATRGYNYAKGTFTVLPSFSMDWGNAAGAIASNVGDLVRWDGAFFGGKVISLQGVQVATTPPARVVMLASKDHNNNLGIGYAFGWVQARTEGRQMIWHNGGLPGARAMNATFPRDALEIVVLTNATVASPEETALKIARVLYDGASR